MDRTEFPPIGEEFVDAADSERSAKSLGERHLLLAAIICSLLLHFALGGALIRLQPVEPEATTPDFVSIRLLPTIPLPDPAPESITEEAVIEETPEPVETTEAIASEEEPEQIAEPILDPLDEPAQENQLADLPEPDLPSPEQISDDQASPNPVIDPNLILIPSTDIVSRSIQSMESESRSRLWAYDCNARQEESELITCDEQQTPNYDRVRDNATYRNLNPTREISRSLQTLPTVAENAGELAGRLLDVNIPEGLSDYLMEEVEAGITHNSDLGDMRTYNIEIMTDNSDSAKFFRETQTDPWRNPGLMTEMKEKQQRQVHIDQ